MEVIIIEMYGTELGQTGREAVSGRGKIMTLLQSSYPPVGRSSSSPCCIVIPLLFCLLPAGRWFVADLPACRSLIYVFPRFLTHFMVRGTFSPWHWIYSFSTRQSARCCTYIYRTRKARTVHIPHQASWYECRALWGVYRQ